MKKNKSRRNRIPILGKYVDTVTNAELGVIYFLDDIGKDKFTSTQINTVLLEGCRFILKEGEAKRKKKFYKMITPFLTLLPSNPAISKPLGGNEMPLVFGLIKLRKEKKRKFVLFHRISRHYNAGTLNIEAVIIDNLLYIDLLNGLKKKP